MSTRAEAARLVPLITICEWVCGAMGILLAIQLLVLVFQEQRLKRPVSKFMLLLGLMGVLQVAQFAFYSVGKFFDRWYLRIPRLDGAELRETYLILATFYNTVSVPKWIIYVAYIYYRSISLSQILEPSPRRRNIVTGIIGVLSCVWIILLLELYFLEYLVSILLIEPREDILVYYNDLTLAISITRYIGGALLVALDLYLQFGFIKYIRGFSKSMGSDGSLPKFKLYYIIAQHCLLSTWLSFISFAFVCARDKATVSYHLILFDVLQNSSTFLLISCLIAMRFRIQLTYKPTTSEL